MIFLTGDIHGELSINKLSSANWPEGQGLCRDDYVIVLGDFGLVWDCGGESASEKYWLDWLESKPWTTLFIDGNHENFDRLESDEFVLAEWAGGIVRCVRPHVRHLLRGEVYEIDGISFLAFGGARSVDRSHRKEGLDWWPRELPDEADKSNCFDNLARHGDAVDVVLTHAAPAAAYYGALSPTSYLPDAFSNWLQDNIARPVSFKRWYFGHHHIDKPWERPFTPLFEDIVELDISDAAIMDDDGNPTEEYAAVWDEWDG